MTFSSREVTLRDRILTTIRVIAANPNANEAELVDCLRALGYEALNAELLVVFVPLGLARAVIRRLPAATPFTLSNHALVVRADRKFQIPLMLVPEFVEALRLGEETFTSAIISREDYTRAVRLSVELNLINEALNAATNISNIAAPVLLRLGDVTGFEEWYSGIKL